MHTAANGKLQADAVAATLRDAVFACRVYIGLSVYVCLTGAMKVMFKGGDHVGVCSCVCVLEEKKGYTMQCQ